LLTSATKAMHKRGRISHCCIGWLDAVTE